ncbi:MAG TPA: cytochrome c-type biogenesis protein CcmH [Dokdonella sp.]|nr:cytochrome c-type biogenesis protein CcmH [Dokdonella sp.]HNS28830.1 cytochrome c-type biogenesis protein CcmH [Steroidobacteraceae bacterium]
MNARAFTLALVTSCLYAAALPAIDTTELPDPVLQERYETLTHELRCMQCQNQSIADSPVGLAADLRREVADQLVAGKTDAEIRDYMAARYGDFILFRPRLSARTAWLWALPGVLLLAGGVIAWRIVRQRSRLAANDPDFNADDPER